MNNYKESCIMIMSEYRPPTTSTISSKEASSPNLEGSKRRGLKEETYKRSSLSSSSPSLLLPTTTKNAFPWKLYKILEDAETDGNKADIISWLSDGNGFKIHKPTEFVQTLLIPYFKTQSKLKSFTRQLYIYGFSKFASGPNAGAFYHSLFTRGDKASLFLLKRNKSHDRRFKRTTTTPSSPPPRCNNPSSSCSESSTTSSSHQDEKGVDDTVARNCDEEMQKQDSIAAISSSASNVTLERSGGASRGMMHHHQAVLLTGQAADRDTLAKNNTFSVAAPGTTGVGHDTSDWICFGLATKQGALFDIKNNNQQQSSLSSLTPHQQLDTFCGYANFGSSAMVVHEMTRKIREENAAGGTVEPAVSTNYYNHFNVLGTSGDDYSLPWSVLGWGGSSLLEPRSIEEMKMNPLRQLNMF